MIISKTKLYELLQPIFDELTEAQSKIVVLEEKVESLEGLLTQQVAHQFKKNVAFEKQNKKVTARLAKIDQSIEEIAEKAKPTVSKMTTAADEQTAIFNEVIDEWLNGKKEDIDE